MPLEYNQIIVISVMTIAVALLGGGHFLLKIFEWLSQQEYISRIDLITAPRHAEEVLGEPGIRFDDRAAGISTQTNNGVNTSVWVVDTLDDPIVKPILSSSDIAFSVSAAWIFKRRHIDLCRNLINIHSAMLPQWRGGGGMSWQILSGCDRAAATFHKLEVGIDTGDIILSTPFTFPDQIKTPKEKSDYMSSKALSDFQILIDHFASYKALPQTREQDEAYSSYFPRLNSSVQACIDWRWTPSQIVKFITAFDDPYPGAFSYLHGNSLDKIFLKKAVVFPGEPDFHPFQAGIVFRIDKNGLYICATGGAILAREAFDQDGACFIPRISLGDRIFTPQHEIELAMSSRYIYTAKGLKEK